MEKLEVLCVTMHQNDFSKIKEMNIQSDVVFANQADRFSYDRLEFNGHLARMITTDLRGVGKNRNTALIHASAEICLFADDDVVYFDGYQEMVLSAFSKYKDADVIIFNLASDLDSDRKQKVNTKFKKSGIFSRMPYGACRIAFKVKSVQKANIWFTTLFGGGCIFPSGEDSLWLIDARRKGLKIYTSPFTIGKVKFENSTWFTGYNERFFWGKGAFYKNVHSRAFFLWVLYFAIRTQKMTKLSFVSRITQMVKGAREYNKI